VASIKVDVMWACGFAASVFAAARSSEELFSQPTVPADTLQMDVDVMLRSLKKCLDKKVKYEGNCAKIENEKGALMKQHMWYGHISKDFCSPLTDCSTRT